jgi:hypothetical protein
MLIVIEAETPLLIVPIISTEYVIDEVILVVEYI